VIEDKLQMTGVSKPFVRSHELVTINGNGSLSSIRVENFGGSFLTTICRSWLASRSGIQLLASAASNRLDCHSAPYLRVLVTHHRDSTCSHRFQQVPTGLYSTSRSHL